MTSNRKDGQVEHKCDRNRNNHWVVLNGELPKQKSQTLAARSILMCTRTKELSALWDLDTLGISDTIQKATQDEHEAKVKEEFQKNLERDKDGRYVIKLPWLTESMTIPDNRNVAIKRLESTSTRVVTKEDLTVTKRTVLSIASQVFDPIGFTSPTVLQLKIMLQEAWAQDLKWDELWGTEAINKVKTWCDEARVLSKIRIPRWAVASIDDLELHTFTDASQNAYSAVVFARSTRENNVTEFASYQKNVRVLAYILRFVVKGAVKIPYPKFMTLPELRFAEVILIRVLQRQYFPDAKKVQPRVILMEDNLLHVRTKLEYSDDSDGFRFPMLLPAKCPLVQELIREMHRFHGHGGVQFTVGKLREKY
ncbi:hypothetical protein Fcan01_19010 [Folsomia candida]|uniref:Integrase zinc-binding domain-containing protein n=1 Tax=Folsomia candida TaxID=158441 RepID=A0A226DMM4_FOLCA|nr:hypothetical protein Fcan01_19010 [Folsomia candida]